MNAHTRLSAKGQVVLPKAVRDRLQWSPGDQLEVVEHAGGVTLRPVAKPKSGATAAEVLAEIWALYPYDGPYISDDDVNAAVREQAVRRYERSR